jgi:hypothetical protein
MSGLTAPIAVTCPANSVAVHAGCARLLKMRLHLAALAMCLSLPAMGADIGYLPGNEAVIILNGQIEPGDEEKFRALAKDQVRRLVLDSQGGDYMTALAIAHQVYMQGIATIAPMEDICDDGPDQSCICASACVFVWAAGRPRYGNMVVVHASDPPDLKGKDPVTRRNGLAATKAHMQDMLRKFGTPEIVVEAMVNTPNQSPRRLTEEELEAMQPFTYVPVQEPQTAKAP